MSNFNYKNPISPSQLTGIQSVDRTKTIGTNFSVLQTGGFMEVYSIDQLYYTVPSLTYGLIQYTGNSIPVTFSKGSGSTFSFDTLILNSDNISSGRKKLGMLVHVINESQIFQFSLDNFESLWSAATGATGVGGPTVVESSFGTLVKANTPEGIAFISGWTANTIDGISGVTRQNAVWKKYYGTNLAITGGSYSMGTLTLVNITGGTVSIPGFGSGGGGGDSITGGTFDITTGELDLSSTASTITIPGFLYGTGTTNNLPKYQTPSGFTNSQIYDNGTSVSIGNSSPSSSAIFELSATTKGFLPPRMTESQRLTISSPAIGLMVYQTDGTDGVYVYKVSGWIQMI